MNLINGVTKLVAETSKQIIKVAFITNIPTPYRKKQWEYYSKCKNLDITVFYCANTEDRLWKINSAEGIKEVFLKGWSYKSYHFNMEVLKVISQDFDVFFVGGYGYPSLIMAILGLKILKKPWVMIIDGMSPLKLVKTNFISNFFKNFIINGASAYFANGKVSKEYLTKYGVLPEKIFNQYLTVDVNEFINKGINAKEIKKNVRDGYGIPNDSIVIMYSGRLIYKKGVQDLLAAVKKLEDKEYNIVVLIVGGGDFKEELERKSQLLKLNIIFTGHIDPEELYKYYYTSDIFILPTHDDPWGLVVNEAMACGLPIIITKNAGSSIDLVENNGYVVSAHNVQSIASNIEELLDSKTRIIAGINSKKLISNWTYKESLNSFLELLRYLKLF
jgi:glycosyltransferase involved in cell wall biosynthesis